MIAADRLAAVMEATWPPVAGSYAQHRPDCGVRAPVGAEVLQCVKPLTLERWFAVMPQRGGVVDCESRSASDCRECGANSSDTLSPGTAAF